MRYAILASLVSVLPLCAELQLVSGQGQLVLEQFPSAPLGVRAVDASGRPIAGVAVTWTVTQGQGSLLRGTGEQTDADGYAWVRFVGTDIQPGTSWAANTVTASSAQGVVPFIITTIQSRLNSGPAPQPSIQYLGVGELKGAAGSTITEAFVVQVAASAGIRLGQGIPNVGIRLVLPEGSDPATAPSGTCRAPGGFLMTDSRGLAICDLVLNRNVGTGSFSALVGESVRTRNVGLEITPGEACTVTLTSNTLSFASGGGVGTANVAAGQTCTWTASSTTPWITISTGGSGTGNGTFNFTIAANTGAARTGTITAGGQTLTVTQAAGNVVGGPLSFTVSSTLPPATVGLGYSIGVNVNGGTPPYTWNSSQPLPAGLSLNTSTGVLSGVPSNAGTASLPIVVRDATGAQITQVFTLVISTSSNPGTGGPLVITTSSFANGSLGVPYDAPLTASGGCQNPFAGGPSFTLVSGSLPPGLTLQSASGGARVAGTPTVAGNYPFAVRATDSCGAASTREFTITIGAAPSTAGMTASPGSVSFTATPGGTQTLDRTVNITTGGTGVAFTAVASANEGNWLSVGPGNGSTPADLVVRVSNYADLQPRTYSGVITVISQAPNSPVTIPVTLTIGGSQTKPALTAAPGSVTFDAALGSTPAIDWSVTIGSTTGSLSFTAAASSQQGNWLSVVQTSGTTPGALTIRAANFSSLPQGSYAGTVTVTSAQAGNSPLLIPVTLNVGTGQSGPALTANPASVTLAPQPGATAAIDASVAIGSSASAVAFSAAVSGQQGNWLSVTQSGTTTPGTLTVRASNYAGLTPGTYLGTINVTSAQASNSPLQIQVLLTVPAAATLSIAPSNMTFDWQPGASVPAVQPITINSTGGPLNFTAVAGTRSGGQWLIVDRSSGSAPATVQVSVNPSGLGAGMYQGSVTITPDTTRVPVVVDVTLRVTQPGPQFGSITNAASFLPGPVSPGEIVTIFGANLGPATLATLRLDPSGMIETLLAGTRVWFDDQLAPIVHTSASQVTVVVPYSIAGRQNVRVAVEHLGARSEARDVPVAASAPGLFTVGGGSQGAILNQDMTANSPQNGAVPGSWVSLYATGEGETLPAVVAGSIAAAGTPARPLLPVRVTIGGREAEVSYNGTAPGLLVGLMQVNAKIPEDTPAGSAAVVLSVGSASSQSGVTVYVVR